jgi:hypothetical protein
MLGGMKASDDGTMHDTRQDSHAANISLLCAAKVMTPLVTWISKELGRSAKFVMRAPTKFTTDVGFPMWCSGSNLVLSSSAAGQYASTPLHMATALFFQLLL